MFPSDAIDERALSRLQRAMGELRPVAAPAELERRLRLAHDLRELPRADVPEELRERVELELSTRLPIAETLRGLQDRPAPHVLDRLVAEELARPAAALTERFVGGLPRVSPTESAPSAESAEAAAPAGEARAGSVLRGTFGARPWVRSVAGLAAAVLGLISLVPLLRDREPAEEAPRRPAFRFARHAASSSAELDPLALALIDGLSGGALQQRAGLDDRLNGGSDR